MGPTVTATYRLQLHADFGFADAAAQVPYLARLGISHLYLSPILAAVPGSMHGYDVLDHSRVSPELGGEEGFRQLAHTAHDQGLGVIVDVVPNHMCMAAPEWTNAQLWQVMREGPDSAMAKWFDVDWAADGDRLGLPVLGDPLADTLAAGELVLESHGGEPVVRYHDHAFPVADGTGNADVATVLSRQHYQLASWRERDTLLNYRRFFEVDQLVGVRVEDPEVFEATHALLLGLHHDGLIDGFRIDHPDGLADPQGYLERLASACLPGTPIWVEKVLEGAEELPAGWPCAGTTGYDALQAIQSALVAPGTAECVSRAWADTGGSPDLDVVVRGAKRQAVDQLLQPELNRLHRRAAQALPGADQAMVRNALVELLVAVDVYRAYVRPGEPPSAAARQRLDDAVRRACDQQPGVAGVLDQLQEIALRPAPADPAAVDFAVRFQQTCGPVMAKGIEDCAFYRWHRLVALNEVGADPSVGLRPSSAGLHDWAERQQRDWPLGMTTLSTHDTKRSEDVRARVLAIAGDEGSWQACSNVFGRAADEEQVDRPTAHLLWQTLAGAGPIARDRLHAYLIKAIREAKDRTAWIDGDPAYEQRVLRLADRALEEESLLAVIDSAVTHNSKAIRVTTLAATLLRLTVPGVPDTYQGCELVDLSLVDPDNRRPVDYRDRAARLAALDRGTAPADLSDEKLWVVSRTLRLRQAHPKWFGSAADYLPLKATSTHVLGFTRGDQVAALVTGAPNALAAQGGWTDSHVTLPAGTWRDELSGRILDGGETACGDLFATLPVALLVRS